MTIATEAPHPKSPVKPPAKLGEELPLFCEKCGYNLNGLPQMRCEHCAILQFHCPECGHHQPLNTLRPAAQRIIGRLRAGWLVPIVLFKVNYFGWLLFAWFAMGVEWSSRYFYSTQAAAEYSRSEIDYERWFAFLLFAVPFGMVGRMLLLRWRRGWIIGMVLGALVLAAIMMGQEFQKYENRQREVSMARTAAVSPAGGRPQVVPTFRHIDVTRFAVGAAIAIVISCAVVWPVWGALVSIFLPKNAGKALLEWQRGQSDRAASALARE